MVGVIVGIVMVTRSNNDTEFILHIAAMEISMEDEIQECWPLLRLHINKFNGRSRIFIS